MKHLEVKNMCLMYNSKYVLFFKLLLAITSQSRHYLQTEE